jgi:hypothetical protein
MAKRKPTAATTAAQRILGPESARLAGLPKDRSVVVGIRLSPALKAQLVAHFRARETDLSRGLRQVILDYVKREGLR